MLGPCYLASTRRREQRGWQNRLLHFLGAMCSHSALPGWRRGVGTIVCDPGGR